MVKNFRTKNPYEDYTGPSKKNSSLVIILIVLITVAVATLIAYMKFDSIRSFVLGEESQDVNGISVTIGDTISTTGMIESDGDLITHTHTLQTQDYGLVGLISKSVDLSTYQGEVIVQGVVEDFQSSMPIIQVDTISSLSNMASTGLDQSVPGGQYIKSAGLYFPVQFFEKYIIVDSIKVDEVHVKNIETEQVTKINYFACTKGDKNKDCQKLEDTNANSAEKSFLSSNGNTFYKFSEVDSRFVANQHRGYYVEGGVEQEIIELSQYMIYPSNEWIMNNVIPNIKSICVQNDSYIDQIAGYNSLKEDGILVMHVSGSRDILGSDGVVQKLLVTCKLEIDPSLGNGASLVSFDSTLDTTAVATGAIVDTGTVAVVATGATEQPSTTEVDNNDNAVQELDFNIAQFPINLNKRMEFKGSKGYTISFPASNITRRPGSVEDKTLGQQGVSCFVQYNVTKYDKTNPEIAATSPSIKIYECRIKGDVSWTNKYVTRTTESDRKFVVEIVDPAWKEFTDNVEIFDQTGDVQTVQ